MMERRLTWLAGLVALWGVFIFHKLVWLQIMHHAQYASMARARQEITVQIPAPRGAIFDRTGQTLAMSVPSESVYVNPLKVPNIGVASDMLALALNMDRADLATRMQAAHDSSRGYFIVKRKLSFDEGQRLRELHQDWIGIEGQSERHYPGGKLAAHVLGSVDFSEKGDDGVERTLDNELRGVAGNFHMLTDVKRRGIDSEVGAEAKPGTPITLTIDERLQFVAEQEIERAVREHGAASGSVVAMNPYTGEILALASYPTFDPNDKSKAGNDPARLDHAISVPFEPGSVFKVITLTAALETTRLTPDSPINCHGGVLTIAGHTIHDSHVGAYGILPMAMVLAHSSNIGAIEVGLTVGKDKMNEYVRRFGFAQRSGLPLPGESRGQLRNIDHWSGSSLPSISMGQEVSVTTLQLARAAAVIANGGLLVTPRLILRAGNQTPPVNPPVRIIKPETAITMRKMMEGVVLYGTGRLVAKIDGYTSGGKTGSAQIYSQELRRYSHDYNGSFMGFAPVTNPAIVVVVTVNGTHGTAGFGGPTAGPVFKAVTTEAMRILDVPRDLIDDSAEQASLAKSGKADDYADASDATLAADGANILDDPEEEDNAAPAAPRAPNFRGMTMRAVLAAAASQGLNVIPDGSGVARLQIPPPGAVLRQGERIRVVFRR